MASSLNIAVIYLIARFENNFLVVFEQRLVQDSPFLQTIANKKPKSCFSSLKFLLRAIPSDIGLKKIFVYTPLICCIEIAKNRQVEKAQ